MPALEAGVHAPEIELQYLDGRKFSLKEERKKGQAVEYAQEEGKFPL